ncbi:uncharacterized protein LOC108670337, partial [Hyalella azteca]|uniref:Uncharacterized protein LOC108670337 n=1 Tax=Hyalella azteca TaxID=294128 RepID=A0A8B7NIX5_HYAAZ
MDKATRATHHPVIKFAFKNVESVENGSLQAKCNFCKFGGGIVKFGTKSYSNLTKHLKRHHLSAYNAYLEKTKNYSSLDAREKSMMKSYSPPSHPIGTTQSILSLSTTQKVTSVPCSTSSLPMGTTQYILSPITTQKVTSVQCSTSLLLMGTTQSILSPSTTQKVTSVQCSTSSLPMGTTQLILSPSTTQEGTSDPCNTSSLPMGTTQLILSPSTTQEGTSVPCSTSLLPMGTTQSILSPSTTQEGTSVPCNTSSLPMGTTQLILSPSTTQEGTSDPCNTSSHPMDTTQSILSPITMQEVTSVPCNTSSLSMGTTQSILSPSTTQKLTSVPSNTSSLPIGTTQFILSPITMQEVTSVPCNTNNSNTISYITEAPLPLKIDTNEENAHSTASISLSNISQQPAKSSHSSSPMMRKIQPVMMYKLLCTSCLSLSNAENFYKNSLEVALAECTHKINDCCCKRKYEELLGRTTEDKSDISKGNDDTFDGSPFLCQYNYGKDQIIHFCKVCLRRGCPSKGKRKIGESWTEGITFTSTQMKNKAMKVHLQSQQHKEALEFSKCDDKNQQKLGFPTREERESATRNAMIAGIFMTSHLLPFRLYTALCAFLSLICPSHLSNPLGNQHQTLMGIHQVLAANYEACLTTMKKFFNNTFAATNSKRKITISCDKGTAPKDVSRQAIVATYVSEDGMPKEMVLGIPMIRQGDAMATTKHVKENVSLFLDPSSVAFVCTNSAAVYTGKKTGMIEMLKTSNEFKSLNGLPDFCHEMENLLQKSMPKWVSDTLSVCRSVAAFINDHNIVKNIIHQYINTYQGSSFTAIPSQCQMCYAKCLHLHLETILKNLPIMIKALPELMNAQTFLCDEAIGLLKLILNDSFVIKVMLIRRLYMFVSEKEKIAQNTHFGPFQYKHLVD